MQAIKFLVGAFCVGVAWGQTEVALALTPLEEQELRERDRREAEERDRLLNERDAFPQDKTSKETFKVLPKEGVSFQIDQILLEGDELKRFKWAQEFLDQYAGQKIGAEGLTIILSELTDGFIARGYVTTRVQVGEQDLTTQILRIQLIPGKIREIRFDEEGQKGAWWNAFPTRPGEILNLRDLEQGLEQMKRVPSQDAKFKLVPGDLPGESDVVITLAKKRAWRAGMTFDDSGSKVTGRYQGSYNIAVDNLFQHNDTFSYTYIHDMDKHSSEKGSSSHSYFYSIPYGYWTYSFSAFPSRYHQTVQGTYSNFQMSGKSENYSLKAQRVIHRDEDSKVMIDFQIGRKFSTSYLEDTEITAQEKDTTSVEIGLSRRKNFSTGLIDMRIAGRQGVPWFGAEGDPELKYQKDMPTFEYFLGTFDFNLMQQFKLGKVPMRYSFNFRGQATRSRLYGSEFFNIGNRYTVRGFGEDNTLSAENGFYVRNELGIPIQKLGMEIYLGLDYGQVTGPSAKYLPGNKLAGSVIGLRGGGGGFYYDVFAGVPVYKPNDFESPKVAYGFQVGFQY